MLRMSGIRSGVVYAYMAAGLLRYRARHAVLRCSLLRRFELRRLIGVLEVERV